MAPRSRKQAASAGQDAAAGGGAAEAARRSTRSTAGKLAGKNWDAPVGGGGGAVAASSSSGSADAVEDSAAIGQTPDWYTKALDYWKSVEPTVNGMLGGYEALSPSDALGSLKFLEEFVTGAPPRIQHRRVLDCGAGIGRVSREVLLRVFDRGDLVEVNPKFVEQAKRDLTDGRLERFICSGLQDFTPEAGRYDAIWSQWVLGHLNDADFVSFFKRCQAGLTPGGLIFVKENICKSGFVIDDEDSSMTRSLPLIKKLFAQAGLTIVKEERQTDFPPEIFAVYMFALSPKAP